LVLFDGMLTIRVLEIQKRKKKMISEAFNEKEDKSRESRMADLSMLLAGQAQESASQVIDG
jgi:hypothetical protein